MLQLVKFVFVGVLNSVLGLGLIYLCMFAGLGYAPANAVGYAVGILFSFAVNRRFTFEDAGAWKRKLVLWLLVAGVAYFANLGAVVFAVRILRMSPYIAQLGGSVVYTLASYVGSRRWVFRGPASDEARDQGAGLLVGGAATSGCSQENTVRNDGPR